MSDKLLALVDCNNFFVSCELAFRPDLIGKPVVVLSNNDGCVVSRSQEAKKLLPMGAPIFKYRDIIEKHSIVCFSGNYRLYGDMSSRVMKVLQIFSPDIEIYSIDEAFIDLSKVHINDIKIFAEKIRKTVVKLTGIPVSVGVAKTKTLCKVANEYAKKFRDTGKTTCVLIDEESIVKVLKDLPVGEIWGVGWNLKEKLNKTGIYTGLDLKNANLAWARHEMTVTGQRMVMELNGVSCIDFDKTHDSKKMIISSRSFGAGITQLSDLKESVAYHISNAAVKLRKQKSLCSFVFVTIMSNKHKTPGCVFRKTQFGSLDEPTSYTPTLISKAHELLLSIYKSGISYKKAGVMLAGIVPQSSSQMNFYSQADITHEQKSMAVMDKINKTWGSNIIKSAAVGTKNTWKPKKEKTSQEYTTNWEGLLKVST